MEQLSSFAVSLIDGSVGRFEAVFNHEGLNPFFSQNFDKHRSGCREQRDDVISKFEMLLQLLLDYGIVNVSVGNWWKCQNLDPFLTDCLYPYISVTSENRGDICSPTATRFDYLQKLYDIELIVHYWCHGIGNNLRVDYQRLKFLQSVDAFGNKNRPFYRLHPQQESLSGSQWFRQEIITRHCYVPTVSQHVDFLLQMDVMNAVPSNHDCPAVFRSLVHFYAKYVAKSWTLHHILKNNRFPPFKVFSILVVNKYNRIIRYKRENKGRPISFNRALVTPLGLYETMIRPLTMIGQIVLNNCVEDKNVLDVLRYDSATRAICIDFLSKEAIECFPSYLINTDLPINANISKSWRSWCKVQSPARTDCNGDREYQRLFRNGVEKRKNQRYSTNQWNRCAPLTKRRAP